MWASWKRWSGGSGRVVKVLLIDVNYGESSTGKIVQDLHEALLAHGDEPAVCYGRGEDRSDPSRKILKFGLDWETRLHAGLTRLTGYTGRFSPRSTRRLVRYIDEFNPDIIHIHELHAYFVDIVYLLEHIASKGIPVVWTFHCEFMYTGKCGHAYECEGWLRGCGSCPHLSDYVATLWFDHTHEMLKEKQRVLEKLNLSIVCPSEWLATRVRQSFLGDRDIQVVHNGIDARIFYPRDADDLRSELGIKAGERIALAVAPNLMDIRKGGQWFLQLAKKNEEKNIKFIMVGVSEGTEPDDVGKNVIVKGLISDKNLLAKYYSIADVFVICSKRENYPTTSIEAQACGTPVIGFNTGGTRDTVAPSMRQYLVTYEDLDALNNALEEILSLVGSGWVPDVASLTSAEMCSVYIGIYEKALARCESEYWGMR